MNLLTQSQEEEDTPIVPDATGTRATMSDDQKAYQVSAPARGYGDITAQLEDDLEIHNQARPTTRQKIRTWWWFTQQCRYRRNY